MPLRNAEALEAPALVELFERAFADPEHAGAGEARRWVADALGDPEMGVLVALRGARLSGLVLVTAHVHAFSPRPWIMHFYAEDGAARRALGAALIAWLAERGYDRAWAINRTGRPDPVYRRLFREIAAVRPIGMVHEFDAGGGDA